MPAVGEKVYIGDGCYAVFDGFAIILTTENGLAITNSICLEPETFISLVNFREKMIGAAKSAVSASPKKTG